MIAKIVVAEDTPEIATVLSDHLAFRGHNVRVAVDAYELMSRVSAERPHLLLLDINMPGADGAAAYQMLQMEPSTKDIPVIFMSAYDLDQMRDAIPRGPRTRFLPKPIDYDKLDAYVAELLPLGGLEALIAQILVADDNPDITTLVGEYLALKGHRIIAVHDGFALSQKAAEHRPHLIIADIQMPGAYGSSAYQILQKDPTTSGIPVLFMSAHPYAKLAAILPKDPKTRFIQKPLDLHKLDEVIAELLPMGGYCP